MGRCEGYYRLENHRCDREAQHVLRASDGELYAVCSYHERQSASALAARWHGETGVRRSPATPLSAGARPHPFAA